MLDHEKYHLIFSQNFLQYIWQSKCILYTIDVDDLMDRNRHTPSYMYIVSYI